LEEEKKGAEPSNIGSNQKNEGKKPKNSLANLKKQNQENQRKSLA